jgi:hypothetical protein
MSRELIKNEFKKSSLFKNIPEIISGYLTEDSFINIVENYLKTKYLGKNKLQSFTLKNTDKKQDNKLKVYKLVYEIEQNKSKIKSTIIIKFYLDKGIKKIIIF